MVSLLYCPVDQQVAATIVKMHTSLARIFLVALVASSCVGAYTPVSGIGINVVNIFWERLAKALGEDVEESLMIHSTKSSNSSSFANFESETTDKHSLAALKERGIDLVRFAASPYCPSHLALWRLGGKNESLYWSVLDSIFDEADAAGVRLIPVVMWRIVLPSLACGEPIGQLFQSGSCSHELLRNYTVDLVQRYQNRESVVVWELKNELNLHADNMHRPRPATKSATHQEAFPAVRAEQRLLAAAPGNCHWDNYNKRTVCKRMGAPEHHKNPPPFHGSRVNESKLITQNVSVAATLQSTSPGRSFNKTLKPPSQCMSPIMTDCSCQLGGRGPEDGYSTSSMVALDRLHAAWVRSNDPTKRPLSSGHAMPRPNAWHSAHSNDGVNSAAGTPHKKGGATDTPQQFCDNLLETHADVELASIHPYVKRKLGRSGNATGNENWRDDEAAFSFVGHKPIRMIDLVRKGHSCIAHIQQEGAVSNPKQLFLGEFGFRQGDNVTLQFVRDVVSLATSHLFDNSISSAYPVLATIWVWEFPPQNGPGRLSLEAGRDEWLLHEIAAANALIKQAADISNKGGGER